MRVTHSEGTAHSATSFAANFSRSERCRSARVAAIFYRLRTHSWQTLREGKLASKSPIVAGKSCHWAKFAAREWQARAFSARKSYWRWLESRYSLKAHDDWLRAVEEVQKPYPGTAAWLLSCSADEGGWGRWVPNSDGYPPGGWMQMYESTFWRMWGGAITDLRSRGYRVPSSAASWYSQLGQALASAYGYMTGRRGEWHGAGCYLN